MIREVGEVADPKTWETKLEGHLVEKLKAVSVFELPIGWDWDAQPGPKK